LMMHFDRVSMRFGDTVALSDFNLELREGELVSLLGPSGCGKTTALRLAAGFLTPVSGKISLNGKEITGVPAHQRNMGMVFQSYSLFPNLSVLGNVEFGLRTRRIGTSERRRICDEMIALVRLDGLEHRFPHQLSGGQQQRVALARALAIRPEVLLLDEPLSALDAKVRLELRDQIRRVQQALRIPTIFVTHDQEEALAISDRVAVMSDGVIEQVDTPFNIYNSPRNEKVARFIGSIVEIPGSVLSECEVLVCNSILSCGPLGIGTGVGVTLMVRPEEFQLSQDTSRTDSLIGRVTRTEFRGSQTMVFLDIPGLPEEIIALAPPAFGQLSIGSIIAVRLVEGFSRVA